MLFFEAESIENSDKIINENWPKWLNDIAHFFANHEGLRIFLDLYLVFLIISFLVFLFVKFKKAAVLTIAGLVILLFYLVAYFCGFDISKTIYKYALESFVIISAVLLAPELRRALEIKKGDNAQKRDLVTAQTQSTIEAIGEAVFSMSAMKVGALITIEQHISLEQYSGRAITLNSDISKELLEQIFIKDSPLHDGGVIIRGNKIVCAAAYYTLTQDTSLDKTVGSRHRAGVGISEVTDSLTIIVSEETGKVHVANQGFMVEMATLADLMDYLNTYLGRN